MHKRLLSLIPLALLALTGTPAPAATTVPDATEPSGHCHGARTESVLDDAAQPAPHCHGARGNDVLSESVEQRNHCHGANGGEALRDNI